jgi:spore maturation protein CgeB
VRIVMFYHSLVSDWNHGNAHFLRGMVSEFLRRGDEVRVFEPEHGWSLENLLRECGPGAIRDFERAYPALSSAQHNGLDETVKQALDEADSVIVHEWNDPALVSAVGAHHSRNGKYRLYFHDTHHRMVTEPGAMARYDLSHYDGVLAYGAVLQELYQRRGHRAWTWHEAADIRVFKPHSNPSPDGDLVWIGNWGDDERAVELNEFLIQPCKRLRLKATVYGVGYPESAKRALLDAGIEYRGWLPNFEVPRVFSRHKVTVHIPRRPYVKALPGIPTIRPFEALACGIPLVCAPWHDSEGLFTPGEDLLTATNGNEMTQHLATLIHDHSQAREMARHGLATIRARHTCAHRLNELLKICSAPDRDPATRAVQAERQSQEVVTA